MLTEFVIHLLSLLSPKLSFLSIFLFSLSFIQRNESSLYWAANWRISPYVIFLSFNSECGCRGPEDKAEGKGQTSGEKVTMKFMCSFFQCCRASPTYAAGLLSWEFSTRRIRN